MVVNVGRELPHDTSEAIISAKHRILEITEARNLKQYARVRNLAESVIGNMQDIIELVKIEELKGDS